VAGGVGALLLAGCGGGGFAEEPARTIAKAAEKDMKQLRSLTMTGTVTDDGQRLTIDMAMTTKGDCAGSVGMKAGTVQVVNKGARAWMKADTRFWATSTGLPAAQVQQVIGDKYVALPPSQNEFDDVCDLDSLLDEMGDSKGVRSKVAGTEDLNGQEAVVLRTKTDEGDPLKVWIAVDEPHHVLRMQVSKGKEPGTITFSGFDAAHTIKPPPAGQVVDLSR